MDASIEGLGIGHRAGLAMAEALLRRVGALFLPDLPCELVSDGLRSNVPYAVLEVQNEEKDGEEALVGDVLTAASDAARRCGVRPGQTVVEARSLIASLVVRTITKRAIRKALGRVAEVTLGFGPTASIETGHASCPFDTVWIDLTGTAHLRGGEEATLLEMATRVRGLGHRVRIAIADGPHLARAAAVFGSAAETVVPSVEGRAMMSALPLEALPLSRDRIVWLHRLGLFTVGEVAALPHETLAGRLGDRWRETLELASGRDGAPLVAYEPPRAPTEEVEWDEGIETIEPLLFALSGLSSRLSARLEGRGEAARRIELFARYDRSIAKLRHVPLEPHPGVFLRIDLPSPLAHKNDLFRVLKSKLERVTLAAPVLGVSITAAILTEAPKTQLLLSGDPAIDADPRSLAVLLAELSSEIGPDNVGVLRLSAVHRPEARTRLVPLGDIASPRSRAPLQASPSDAEFPTRVLPSPVPLEPIPGDRFTVTIDNQLFTLQKMQPTMRLDQVEWWTMSPVCRDYARARLTSGRKNIEGWIFTDRRTGRTFLHGYFD